jgi:hypothetical protein
LFGLGVAHCGGDSDGSDDGGSTPSAGEGGGAGETNTGGSSGAGRGGSSGSGGRGGTTTGGSAGDAGAPSGGSGGAADGGTGGSGDGGTPSGGAGDGGDGGSDEPACDPAMPSGTPVALGQATATFSQTMVATFSIANAIDGMKGDQLGWAIAVDSGTTIGAQTAAFETLADTSTPSGTRLSFVLTHDYSATGDHALGRFRISVTNADRATFADGNAGTATPGDVGADGIWSPLDPTSVCALGDVQLTELGDSSLLAGVNHVVPTAYLVVATAPLTAITGVRLEALEDASLPFNGPGLQASNGNFVLTEFEMYAEAP